jgi:hypothetical protein
MLEHLEVIDGVCRFRPRGECSLVEAVELINRAIVYCRDRNIARLFADITGLVGVSVPSLVDRFLLAEDWAHEARGMVVVALVVHVEFIHPEKFGARVARDLGLKMDIFSSETDALKWLLSEAGQT